MHHESLYLRELLSHAPDPSVENGKALRSYLTAALRAAEYELHEIINDLAQRDLVLTDGQIVSSIENRPGITNRLRVEIAAEPVETFEELIGRWEQADPLPQE